jgi:Spy/CpxP family protein refolding chaperone
MKKMMMTAVAGLFAATMMAQEPVKQERPKTPEERAEMITKRMTTQLKLSDSQQEKVKSLILEREKARERNEKNRQEQMEKMDAEMKTLLSPEQYAKWTEKRKEMKEKRAAKMREKHGPEPKRD